MAIATFPHTLIGSLTGGPRFSTDITIGASGNEVRNANWQDALWRWDAGGRKMSRADAFTLYTFFLTHHGRETSFLIQDGFDYKIPQTGSTFQSIGTGDGSDATWQIYKRYTDSSSNTYDRNIYRPAADPSLAVKVAGVLKTVTTHYTYSSTTGIITFTGGNIPTGGQDISITLGTFYTLARFDIDEFPIDMSMWNTSDDYSLHDVPSIPIVEVRET
jgi:uncharacterized protein (TIGR02217 family)